MSDNQLFILAVLASCVVLSELLVRHTWLRHAGTALVVIVVTAIVANLGIIPTSSGDQPVYNVLFREGAWIAIFWLLLQVHLREVLRAGWPMIALFLLGSGGTVAGVIAGMAVIDGPHRIGEAAAVLGGMFTGTYTGGSTNFIAIASHYEMKDGLVLAAANAVDAAMTTVWMAVTLLVPRLLTRAAPGLESPGSAAARAIVAAEEETLAEHDDTETVNPLDLALLFALGAFAVWLSDGAAAFLDQHLGLTVPPILILTTLALALAQVPAVGRLRGAKVLGMLGVYLFLAVIGALCDFASLRASGSLGLSILGMVTVILIVHGVVVFGAAKLLRLDPDVAAVASQANVGGGTTALALARSLGRPDLVVPGILVGSLGTALGTYLGLLVTTWLA